MASLSPLAPYPSPGICLSLIQWFFGRIPIPITLVPFVHSFSPFLASFFGAACPSVTLANYWKIACLQYKRFSHVQAPDPLASFQLHPPALAAAVLSVSPVASSPSVAKRPPHVFARSLLSGPPAIRSPHSSQTNFLNRGSDFFIIVILAHWIPDKIQLPSHGVEDLVASCCHLSYFTFHYPESPTLCFICLCMCCSLCREDPSLLLFSRSTLAHPSGVKLTKNNLSVGLS